MSAVITTVPFGDQAAVCAAEAGNAAFSRALTLGYSRTMAREFARTAKACASPYESAASVAVRIVPERSRWHRPGPGGTAA